MEAGRLLRGRYRLESLLASGGMAQVWRGTDEVLRRKVAVKVLHPHLAADQTFVARFRQEAIAAARLAHPGIVSIYDTCSDDGVEAIVMELVDGRTLRERLDDPTPLDPWQAAGVAAQVAEAL
ncbi:MAG TPA: protein kinase, partial [Acidimicrobiales bacterium]|nr:protein kinase [Acidimicrobiales bacterium]